MKPLQDRRSGTFEKVILHNLSIMGEILRVAQNEDDVVRFAVKIFERIGFAHVRVWLMREGSEVLTGAESNHLPAPLFQKTENPLSRKREQAVVARAISLKKPYINTHPGTLQALMKKAGDTLLIRETLEFPLVSGKNMIGLIDVDNTPNQLPLSSTEAEIYLMPIVNHIALTLSRVIQDRKLVEANSRLTDEVALKTEELREKNERLKYFALHDELTHLPNRRHFNSALDDYFAKATNKKPITLAMIDVDYFKQANDTHGHTHGDAVLRKVAEVLRTKDVAYAARYAGDEFVVILEGKNYPEDKEILQRLCKESKKKAGITLSIGGMRHPHRDIETPLDLIRAADDALYHAKHSGRNQAMVRHEPGLAIPSFAERKKALLELESKKKIDLINYVQQLEVMRDIGDALQKSHSDTAIANAILAILKKRLGLLRIRMYVLQGDEFVCWYATGLPKTVWSTLRRPVTADTLVPRAARERRIINIIDQKQLKTLSPVAALHFSPHGSIAIPLRVDEVRTTGVLVCDYDHSAIQLDAHDYDFLTALGSYIALALERAWLLADIKKANTDLEHRVSAATEQIQSYAVSLEERIKEKAQMQRETEASHFEFVKSLVATIESKDPYTSSHSARVTYYALKLATLAKLPKPFIEDIRYGALLHDIGKLTIDQRILNKATPLTDDEVRILSKHPETGYAIVKGISFLKNASLAIRSHHERYDGKGYPDKLKGEHIPLQARIVHIADSFDAMVSRRSYGYTFTIKDAVKEFRRCAGTQFDPALTRIFVKGLQAGEITMLKDA